MKMLSFLRRWTLPGLALGLLFGGVTFGASPVPSGKPLYYPAWWFERDVVKRTANQSNPVYSTDYLNPDDYGVINQGQLKNLATKAKAEMVAKLPPGVWSTTAGENLTAAVSWTPGSGDDYQAINLGQLKGLAKKFYDVLNAAGYTVTYPWTGTGADDFAVANLGQAKRLFAFDLTTTPGQLPSWWQSYYFNVTSGTSTTGDPDGDGLTNIQEFQQNSNPNSNDTDGDGLADAVDGHPIDYYNGVIPEIEIVSGNYQNGLSGSYTDPLVVRVKVVGVNAFNAPVFFNVTQGGGKLVTANTGAPVGHPGMFVRTDTDGLAKIYSGSPVSIYYQQPAVSSSNSQVKVTAGAALPVQFNLTTSTGEPLFSLPGGSYTIEKFVKITGYTGSTVRYTVDGTTPNSSSPVVTNGGVWVQKNLTLKARSYVGSSAGPVTTAQYVLTGQISAGSYFNLALRTDGRIWSWGSNGSGRLGDSTTTNRTKPTPVNLGMGLKKAVYISAGDVHAGAVDEEGNLWLWGENGSGELGNGMTNDRSSPEKVWIAGHPKFVAVACGNDMTLALTDDGQMYAWGQNSYGQLGDGTTIGSMGKAILVQKPVGMGTIIQIGVCLYSSYALDSDGKMWSWGENNYGQLGNGNTTDQPLPVEVSTSSGMSSIASFSAEGRSVIARTAGGVMWAWGENLNGELGRGNYTNTSVPIQVSSSTGLTSALAVAMGQDHAMAVSSSNQAWTWGANTNGQLGNNSTTLSNVPVQVTTSGGLTGVSLVSGSVTGSLAIKTDGTVWAWGSGSNGQLGNGATSSSLVPVSCSGFNVLVFNDDSDNDGMSDYWESFYFGSLSKSAAGDEDSDGLTNILEYQQGGIPINVTGYSFVSSDSDGDGMTDGFEYTNHLDLNNSRDALEDTDGDRIPNLWEAKRGTDPQNPASAPSVDWVVDPANAGASSSDNIEATITAAIAKVPVLTSDSNYSVILVKAGTYHENVVIPANKRVVLLAEQGPQPVTINANVPGANALKIFSVSLVDGFEITKNAETFGNPDYAYSGVYIGLSPSDQARLVNCIVHGHWALYGGGVFVDGGQVDILHCTFFGNEALTIGDDGAALGNSVYADVGVTVRLFNSIAWSYGVPWGDEVANSSSNSARIIAVNSIIRGGIYESLDVDPLLTADGFLTAASPARFAGAEITSLKKDLHGVVRPKAPDIGASQFNDVDNDGLPDWWETKYFSNLSKNTNGDNESPTPDGLINKYEYLFGLDPTQTDTYSTGHGDLAEAVGMTGAFYYPSEWKEDADKDGLSAGLEMLLGSNPNDADSNNDGLADGAAYQSGWSLTSSDLDGDGVSNSTEISRGTSIFVADTDGDTHNDDVDAYPLDPSRWQLPGPTPGDTTPPVITLTEPVNATVLP